MIASRLACIVALLGLPACADDDPDDDTDLVLRSLNQPGSAYLVVANADGSFSPSTLHVRQGDVVVWNLQRGDTVVPIGTNPDVCNAALPYNALDDNEFVGPMPVAPGGVFTISPPASVHGPDHGLVEVTVPLGVPQPCGTDDQRASAPFDINIGPPQFPVWLHMQKVLCASGTRGASMASTYADPDLSGVFVRVLWSDIHHGPGDYDFSTIDREIRQAVDNGKLYSLAFTAGHYGTPAWIFDAGVRRVTLQDHADGDLAGCGSEMDLGAPNDPIYQQHYFDMLTAVAAHLKTRADWYRALAYIKPSGANLFTSENRLPKSCDLGCICNPEAWSLAGYESDLLEGFYAEQSAVLVREFPGKTLSYMEIQDGFPRINEDGGYVNVAGVLTAGAAEIGGLVQTKNILAQGKLDHGLLFASQHNGLQPLPAHACPNPPGLKGCPQQLVVDEGATGQYIAFQTQNIQDITNSAELDSALQNGWTNSTAGMIEIYEERLWEARAKQDLDLAGWDRDLRDRRAQQQGSPFDLLTHAHAFVRTSKGNSHVYINGTRCDPANPRAATIIVDP